MTGHAAFLRAVLSTPADDTPRLVYADWLDEQTDPSAAPMAEFLRLTAAPPTPDGDRRLRELAAGLAPDWLAVVSRLAVENCQRRRVEPPPRRVMPLRFDFVCDRRWEHLRPTADPAVRVCDGCRRNVYYCDSITAARRHARQDRCVAVDLAIPRQEFDIGPRPALMGKITARVARDLLERERPDPVSAERDRRRAERQGEGPATG